MGHADRIYRLLIVDDDEIDRRLYGWLLERQAPGVFEIEHAADGAAGIGALRARTFDCALLDFSLPDVTGLEFLTDALVDGELPSAVVLITGDHSRGIAAGVTAEARAIAARADRRERQTGAGGGGAPGDRSGVACRQGRGRAGVSGEDSVRRYRDAGFAQAARWASGRGRIAAN